MKEANRKNIAALLIIDNSNFIDQCAKFLAKWKKLLPGFKENLNLVREFGA